MITSPTLTLVRGFRRVAAHAGLFIWLFLLCLSVTAQVVPTTVPVATEPSPGALTNLLAQMEGLQNEAATRSPAQKKIHPSLLEALREYRGLAPRTYAPHVRSGLTNLANGRTLVEIRATVTSALLTNIQQLGGVIVGSYPQYQAIEAEVPLESLESIASLPGVNTLRPALKGDHNTGSATSEGDVGHAANTARATYGATGAGVKIGVLSDSDRFLTISQSTGDTPASVTVLPGQSGVGTNGDEGEGTAMMEIVHDLAPNAQLFFATADPNDYAMAANILSMATNYGCQIIIDDFTYPDESPFHENEPISQALKTASDLGILCFTAAGNDGDQDGGTSGTWQGDFNPSSTTLSHIAGTLHNWGNGSVFNLVTNKNAGSAYVALYWTDPWGGSSSDYNLYVTDGVGNVILYSNYQQAGGANDYPIELTAAATNGQYVVVSRVSGPGRMIQVTTHRGGLAISTASAIRGHNGSSAANVFGVAGMVAQGRTVPFGTSGSNDIFYTYSSDGPRRIFYQTDGTAVTPGNFTSSGGRVLQQPAITAATGVTSSTTFATNSGFAPFYGTSAAAPHAGAIAALMLSYRPDLSAGQVLAAMSNSAYSSLGTYNYLGASYARDTGAGIIMANQAIAYLTPTVAFVSPTNGAVLSYSSAVQVLGYSGDNTASISNNRVALSRNSDGVWYNFVSGTWGTTTFNFTSNVLIATGALGWSAQLPLLPAGAYTIQAQSVDEYNHASPWLSETFTIVSPPAITFSPLTNTETVFDFSQLGGTVNETATMVFRIEQYDPVSTNDIYWNGSSWEFNGNDPSVYLPATVTGGNWAPTHGVTLPSRAQTIYGPYYLRAIATDAAGDASTNQILVTRSTRDTTTPIITMNSFASGAVFTNTSMPALSGSALDYASGVTSVTVYLNRFTSSGVLYWNGSSWSSTAAALTTTYNAQTVAWQVTSPMPSGANLPNAAYQVQISAVNNEYPSGSSSLSVNFSVSYHPVFVFNYGSQYGLTPSMNWSDPANWDVGAVPTPDAVVSIVGYSPDNTSLGSLQLYGLNITNGMLTTLGMLITNLNVSGGVLAGGAITLPTGGVFNWTGGQIMGTYNVPVGATVNITGGADKTLVLATLVNNGTTYWNGGNLYASYGSAITNNTTFIIQSSDNFNDTGLYYGYGYATPTFVNNGLLQKTVSNGETIFGSDAYGGVILNQNGTIDVENGSLSSQTLLNINGGAVFKGPGETRLDAGTMTITGTNTIQQGATLELATGYFNGTGILTGPGTLIWSGGIFSANLNLQSNVNFNITGASDKTLTLGTITSGGPCTWTGTGNILISYGSVFTNNGTFTMQCDSLFNDNGADYGYGYPVPLFVNNGSLIKNNSSGTNATSIGTDPNGGVAFNNNGNISIQSGNLLLGGGGAGNNGAFYCVTNSHIDLVAGTFSPIGNLSFSGAGSTRVNGGTVLFGYSLATLNSGSTFAVLAGNVGGTNVFTGPGTFAWSGGTFSGTLSLPSSVAFNITGASDKTLTLGTITSGGPCTWTGTGNILISYGSAFTNNGTFTMQCDSLFNDNGADYGYGYPVPLFVNNGTLIKNNSSGTNATSIGTDPNGGVAFNNNGNVSIQSGYLLLGGGGAGNNGAFATAAGSHIDFVSGIFSPGGNLSFTGAGSTRVNGGTVLFGNSLSTFSAGGTFEVLAGTAGGTNTFAGTGNFGWSGGFLSGAFNLPSSVAFNISGASDKTFSLGSLASSGPATWTGTGNILISYGSAFTNNGTLTVQCDSLFNDNGADYGYGYPVPLFVNNGTLRKMTTTGTTSIGSDSSGGIAFTNNGLVDLQVGTLAVGGLGETSTGSSRLNLVLGGSNPGTQFSQENFTTATALGGTLSGTLANGFSPTNGQTFAVVNYPSETGQFAVTQLPALPVSLQWQTNYGATALTLKVVKSTGTFLSSPARLSNGHFQFTLNGSSATSAIIQGSTNLVTWIPLQTNTPFTGTVQFDDAHAASYSNRYYRVQIQP